MPGWRNSDKKNDNFNFRPQFEGYCNMSSSRQYRSNASSASKPTTNDDEPTAYAVNL